MPDVSSLGQKIIEKQPRTIAPNVTTIATNVTFADTSILSVPMCAIMPNVSSFRQKITKRLPCAIATLQGDTCDQTRKKTEKKKDKGRM